MARYADSYPRIRYDEAIETLQGMGVEIEWGQDLDYSRKKSSPDFDVPHFLTITQEWLNRSTIDLIQRIQDVLCHDLLTPRLW